MLRRRPRSSSGRARPRSSPGRGRAPRRPAGGTLASALSPIAEMFARCRRTDRLLRLRLGCRCGTEKPTRGCRRRGRLPNRRLRRHSGRLFAACAGEWAAYQRTVLLGHRQFCQRRTRRNRLATATTPRPLKHSLSSPGRIAPLRVRDPRATVWESSTRRSRERSACKLPRFGFA
jgi:hypothetical protein